MSKTKPGKTPEKRRGYVPISFWCPEVVVKAIDKDAAQMQEGRIARVHRSDVIKKVLAERFGIDLAAVEAALEDEDEDER